MTPRRPALFHWGVVLLYFGVLAAGAARQDWRLAIPVGAAAMLLWTVLMRARREWLGAVRTPFTVLVQTAVAAFVWLLGRWAIAPLVAVALPLWATAGLSLAGVALGRLAWGRSSPAAMETFLDDALTQLEASPPGAPDEDGRP